MKLSETKSFQRIPVIYGIQNSVTKKWYIGSCLDMKDRFQRHRYYLRHNMHHSEKLQRSYNMYGEDSFDVSILHFLTDGEDRFKIEQEFIEKYNSVKGGYNMLEKCIYVENFTLSEEAKSNFMKYIETLEKSVISINRKTGEIDGTFKSVTEAAKYYHTSSSNISRVCKGSLNYIKDHVFLYTSDFDETKDYRVEHHCSGKPKPVQQREKMRHNRKCSPIYKYDMDGKLITQYYSISDAARQNGFSVDWIRQRINRKKEVEGYIYSKICPKDTNTIN